MKDLEHLLLRSDVFGKSEKYNAKPGRGHFLPERDRITHANKLLKELQSIQPNANQTIDGVQVEFYGQPNSHLETKSLESRQKGIYLLNQRHIKVQEKMTPVATVYLPRGKPNAFFADKITEYRDKETGSGKPKNDRLIRSIEKISSATLKSFWYGDDFELPDQTKSIWCEVWLVRPIISKKKRIKTNSIKSDTCTGTNEIEMPFIDICHKLKIECRKNSLQFPEMEDFSLKPIAFNFRVLLILWRCCHQLLLIGNRQGFGWRCRRENNRNGLMIYYHARESNRTQPFLFVF